jgi:osmoprotectant transport system ATP-binding protein
MDEPFSAVDPVVRENLQDELLKLQSDLGKTILFVTHDIDEAVKLGDRVAVLRVGGRLAQYDEPGVLLSRPADEFVDNFVGRDRGYRGLSFLSSAALPLHELRTVHGGDRTEQGWSLVLDADGRPLGWHHDRTGGATADAENLVPGGSLYDTSDGSLRSALDAALSSPSGQGVAIDRDGRAIGAVAADDVLTALAAVRRDDAA